MDLVFIYLFVVDSESNNLLVIGGNCSCLHCSHKFALKYTAQNSLRNKTFFVNIFNYGRPVLKNMGTNFIQ